MGERDPRVDPREGDVLRWTVDDGDAIVAVVLSCTPTFVDVVHVDSDGDSWIEVYAADRWSEWDQCDGVTALHPRDPGGGE